jgi:PAS domain S-box-containing protein
MAHKPSYEELERQVKESDNKYRNLLNTSLVGIYQTSIKGGFFYANEALATIFGFESPEEMLLESVIVRYKYAEDREVLIQSLKASGGLKDFEFEALTKSGETINILLSAVLEKDTISGMIMDITDRKKAETALKESEERYRSLFKNNHSIMLLIDPESADIVDANPAAVAFYGWNFEALTSKKISDINTLSDEQVFQEMGKAKTEQRRVFYFRHRLANGEVRDVEVFSGPIKVHGRELLYSIVHDISKRKRVEEELRRYQIMVESAHDAIFCKDLESRYISANDKTLEAFELSREDVIGKNDYELMPDQKEAKKNVHDDQIVFKSGKPTEVFKHMTGADGKEYWFQAIKVPLSDNDGKVIGLVGIARDITKQKTSEEALRKSEEEYHRLYKLLRLMADNIPDLIWAKDMDGRYMFVNQAMCDKLIMCDPAKATGMTNMVIAEKERNAGYDHTFGELCVNSDAIIQERKVACRILEEGFVRNKYLVLDVHKAPFLDENKEMIGTVGCGRDVTNEKKVEKALKEREIELERKNLRLEELNSALKVLLEKRDGDKMVIEEKVLLNIKNLIIPYVVKLKKTPLNDRQEIFLEIILSNIEDILSPFAHKLSYNYLNFTPTELQVADLVKQGLRTKEIADLLNSSPETVSGHRKSMRKKLNLKDKKSNLRTHLLYLDNGYI